jgi:signal transduction histidine kinase
MAAGLAIISTGIWLLLPIQFLEHKMLLALLGLVVVGSGATFVGAWRLAGSAVRPVLEIAEQATRIEAGTLDQRISAHATAEEYRGLVAVLNRMLDRLASAFTVQQRFTSDVSHELRTPLTALRGEIEVTLRAERAPREYQRVLRSALEEIERMTAMTEELLLINRIESRQLTAHREPTDVHVMVTESLERLRHRIAEKERVIRSIRGSSGGSLTNCWTMRSRTLRSAGRSRCGKNTRRDCCASWFRTTDPASLPAISRTSSSPITAPIRLAHAATAPASD